LLTLGSVKKVHVNWPDTDINPKKKNKKKNKDCAINSLISLVGNRKTTVFVWNRAGAITALNEL
jgi:hypothetical protein